MRRHRAEHGSIEHDALLKILETEGTELRQLITGRVVLGWPFQVCSAIKFLGRFLTELADCLGTKGKHSVPIRLVRTAEGAVGELRRAKPLEHTRRKPPADRTEQSKGTRKEDAATIPRQPVGVPGGATPSVQGGAKQGSPLDETVGYVWMNASEAARFIGTTDKTIREWIADHKLAIYGENGNSYKFRQDELDVKKASWRPRRAGSKRMNPQSD
jgi:excisionase family DNA binding protein